MFVVRYVALVALAVWLGDMVVLTGLTGPAAGETTPLLHLLTYVCGGVILVCLFVIKFVGPPPRAFTIRAAVVALMLCIALYADLTHGMSKVLTTINVALALTLLAWYARE